MISATTLSIDALMTGVLPALLLPLLSAVVCFLVREKYAWLAAFLSPVFLLLSLGAAAYTWFSFWGVGPAHFSVLWFSLGGKAFEVSFLLNNTSVLMMLMVTSVSFLVHVYSIGYMADDAAQGKYFCMLGLFTFRETHPETAWISSVLQLVVIFALFLRGGLLAITAASYVVFTLSGAPLTRDLSVWYAPSTIVILVALFGIALYAFRAALGGRPAFSGLIRE